MITAIVAVDKNHGIGLNGQLPWPYLKEDMAWFKNNTINNIVIMGSKTYKSIGKPLSDRINIVLSKNEIFSSNDGSLFTFLNHSNIFQYVALNFPEKELFVIGGGQIYSTFMEDVDRFFVTEIDEDYNCDTFFDLNFVKTNFKQVINHGSYTDPVNYTIKEYLK